MTYVSLSEMAKKGVSNFFRKFSYYKIFFILAGKDENHKNLDQDRILAEAVRRFQRYRPLDDENIMPYSYIGKTVSPIF